MLKLFFRIINSVLKYVGIKIIHASKYNFEMESALKRISSHNIKVNSVIDIGGSSGVWSLKAMQILSSASYLAIEPLVERYNVLNKIANKYKQFSFEICAAGEKNSSKALLNVTEDLDGSSIDGYGGEKREIPVKTIDSIVCERNLSGPYLLKLDTHGYELPIINGARLTLKDTSILIIESYNFKLTENCLTFHELCSHLEKLNFRCYDLADPMLREYDKALWQVDLFFCKSDEKIFAYTQYK